MTLDILKGSAGLRVVKVLSNGKRRFDPVEKDRLIDAAMKPGVSVELGRKTLWEGAQPIVFELDEGDRETARVSTELNFPKNYFAVIGE